ncbi:hypothetical protein U9M48_010280 [Paspalum notatum var. saurae]|uniref:Uncharacterized protein n=1 Tax=Paspalum notatum var. saurae TaxID=547442 RepID=A0AAQ3STV5_PASNO
MRIAVLPRLPRQAQAVATGAVTANHPSSRHRQSPTPRSQFPHPATPTLARKGPPRSRAGSGKRRGVPSRRAQSSTAPHSGAERNGTARGHAHHARDRDTARRERDGNVRAAGPRSPAAAYGRAGPGPQQKGPRAWCARTAGRGKAGPRASVRSSPSSTDCAARELGLQFLRYVHSLVEVDCSTNSDEFFIFFFSLHPRAKLGYQY